jgi:hypothetical protein
MRRLPVFLGAVGLALLPATLGLFGNASFSQSVPVQAPADAQVATSAPKAPSSSGRTVPGVQQDRRGGGAEPGDDRAAEPSTRGRDDSVATGSSNRGPGSASTGSGSVATRNGSAGKPGAAGAGNAGGAQVEPGDDRGGARSGASTATSSGRSPNSGSGSATSGGGGQRSGRGGSGGGKDDGSANS